MSNVFLNSERPLHSLTKKEFDQLKKSGMLWELYPEAPEHWEWAGRDQTFEHISHCDADHEG